MEVFGGAGTAVDQVCRFAKVVHELRELYRLSKTNPVQCERILGSLRMVQGFLEEKSGLSLEQTACLGLVWESALQEVHDGVKCALEELETLVEKGRSLKQKLHEFFKAGRVRVLLDKTEQNCSEWRDRLCAADATLTYRHGHQEVLAELRKLSDYNLAFWRVHAEPRTYFRAMNNVLFHPTRDFSRGQMALAFVESENSIHAESSLSSALVRSAHGRRNLDEMEGYEQDRQAFIDLDPRAKAFLKDLESGTIGTRRLSDEEKKNVATTFETLWRPWAIDAEGIIFDVRTNGRSVQLGQGSYGTVLRGRWERLGPGNKVAVKILCPEFGSGESFRSDFYREASLLHRLRHPSIVRFYCARWPDRSRDEVKTKAVDEGDDDAAWLVMELMDGDASSVMEKGDLTERQDVTNLLLHIAEALEFIHDKNVLHLDVKPQNILLRVRDGRLHGRAKLSDFGVSRLKRRTASLLSASHSSSRGGRGPWLGTAAYMAPELFDRPLTKSPDSLRRGEGSSLSADIESKREGVGQSDLKDRPRVSAACDVYSFGIAVCYLLHLLNKCCAKIPDCFIQSEGQLAVLAYEGKLCAPMRRWVETELSRDGSLREIALACVQDNPADRPSMSSVVNALRLVGNEIGEEPPSLISVLGSLEGVDVSNSLDMCRLGVNIALRETDQTGKVFDVKLSSQRAVSCFRKVIRDTRVGQTMDANRKVALCNLGWCYEHGFGVRHDFVKAARLYEEAQAFGNLAVLYRHGFGVIENETTALDFLNRQDQNQSLDPSSYPSSWSNICYLVEDAALLPDAEIQEDMYGILLKRASDNGSAEATNKLGILSYLGKSVRKDFDRAVSLFSDAKELDSVSARANLAFVKGNPLLYALKKFAREILRGLFSPKMRLGLRRLWYWLGVRFSIFIVLTVLYVCFALILLLRNSIVPEGKPFKCVPVIFGRAVCQLKR